ncbi:hypothetical protein EHS13_30140 [Paenibacillus psychroresistens]|uniref:Uncharacterized protein n=1 Tax=Paenibacillus psychroresistens TaxID=1778678 RepID=A0A6B8RUK6_9BACL|nr:hypothetical protein [Paenibacillus psychroresistens]QGQ98838.1 hypothetical protein EHS13_30140 [Paenibacillus psychroresistens]
MKKKFQFQRRMSIQRKIFIAFILVMIIPTMIISISSYLISIQILKEKVSLSFGENLTYLGNSIERKLLDIDNLTGLAAICNRCSIKGTL